MISCLLVVETRMLRLYGRQTAEFNCLIEQVAKQLEPTHTSKHGTMNKIITTSSVIGQETSA